MEALHALRFLARWLQLDPEISMDDWSAMYMVQGLYPHRYPCGCPDQILHPGEPRKGPG